MNDFSEWKQDVFCDHFTSLFRDKPYFDIVKVNVLGKIVSDVGGKSFTSKTESYIFLNSLHCILYEKMSEKVINGLKEALFKAIGINDDNGSLFFGSQWDYVKGVSINDLLSFQGAVCMGAVTSNY